MVTKIIDKYKNSSAPIRAAFWYTFCNVLNKGIALLTTPIFTRILSEEQYGDFAIFHSWYSILLIFTSLNIFMSGYTKGLLKYKNQVNEFTSSQLSLVTVMTLLWTVVYFCAIPFWTKVLEIPFHLMIAMIIQLILMPAMEFWMSKERFAYHYKNVVIVTLLCNALCVGVGVIAVMISPYKLEARVYTDAFFKVIFAAVLFVVIFTKGKTFFNKEWWKYALSFNLPLIPHFLANYVLNQSDRIMIGRMVGSKEAGFYSVAYTISMMMFLIVNAINNAVEPYIYRSVESKSVGGIKKTTNILFLLIAFLTIGVMACAPEIIMIFGGEKYADAMYVVPPISVAVFFIFAYSFYSTIEYYYQQTKFIAAATTICAALNLILNYFGIKLFGYYAAGFTTLICYILLAVLHYCFYRKILKKEMPEVKDIYDLKVTVLIGLGLIMMMCIMLFTYHSPIIRYGMLGIALLVMIFFRENLIGVLKSLKKQ